MGGTGAGTGPGQGVVVSPCPRPPPPGGRGAARVYPIMSPYGLTGVINPGTYLLALFGGMLALS
jgi:hypothetical protein